MLIALEISEKTSRLNKLYYIKYRFFVKMFKSDSLESLVVSLRVEILSKLFTEKILVRLINLYCLKCEKFYSSSSWAFRMAFIFLNQFKYIFCYTFDVSRINVLLGVCGRLGYIFVIVFCVFKE